MLFWIIILAGEIMKKLNIRQWLSFIVAGFVGQLAWAIENNYLNLYVFKCTGDYIYIPIMTAASAAAATITTLLMGALSDRLGKRKAFISFGYILWGISIIMFAFLDPSSNLSFVSGSVMASGTMIVVMDCVMTFFGSTANDAAFNAYVTDKTNESNRAKVESVLSILPLVSMIAVVVVGGIFTSDIDPRWDIFFYIFGGLTLIAGIGCIFLLPKDEISKNAEEPYIKNIFYGFRPTVIKDNKKLYIMLCAFFAFNLAIQIFMPYLMVYIKEVMSIRDNDFTVTLGIVLVLSSIITVVFGLFMDKIGKNRVMIPALLLASLGGLLMFFANNQVFIIIAATVLMTGYLIGTAAIGAKVRDLTPTKETGLFQGVRMVFVVLLPMVTGPYIGLGLSYINGNYYINEYGKEVIAPNNFIFLGACIALLIAIIPIIIFIKTEKREQINA